MFSGLKTGRIAVELQSMILPGNEQKFLKCNPESIKELKDRTVEKEGSALTSLNRRVDRF